MKYLEWTRIAKFSDLFNTTVYALQSLLELIGYYLTIAGKTIYRKDARALKEPEGHRVSTDIIDFLYYGMI